MASYEAWAVYELLTACIKAAIARHFSVPKFIVEPLMALPMLHREQ